MKKILFILFLLSITSSHSIEFNGKFIQGHFITGKTEPGTKIIIGKKEVREKFEKEYLIVQLKKFNGNISKTASFVGMERSALHRKLKGLGIKEFN
jgi:DNA-binding NtrC family response regulator